MRNLLLTACLALLASFAIASCGGDDETTTTAVAPVSGATGTGSVTPLSEDEFVSQGNSICADLNEQLAALEPPSDDPQSLAEYATESLSIVEPAVAEFEALVPPEDLQDQFDAYVLQIQDRVSTMHSLQEAAAAGDIEQIRALIQELNAEDTEAPTALGLDECAEDAQPEG